MNPDMPSLTFKVRCYEKGKSRIAPFINGWNVWAVEEWHWTTSVQQAIKHAYELGYQQALATIDVSNVPYILDKPFLEDPYA